MSAVNPIPPDRDPVVPSSLLPAVQRVSPEQKRKRTRDDEPGDGQGDEENFEQLLDEVVDDDYSVRADGAPGPPAESDTVTLYGDHGEPLTEPDAAELWRDQNTGERRTGAAGEGGRDGEDRGPHIDISA